MARAPRRTALPPVRRAPPASTPPGRSTSTPGKETTAGREHLTAQHPARLKPSEWPDLPRSALTLRPPVTQRSQIRQPSWWTTALLDAPDVDPSACGCLWVIVYLALHSRPYRDTGIAAGKVEPGKACFAVEPGQQERLSGNRGHLGIEVRQQDSGQLQPALIRNETARRCRPVPTRVEPPALKPAEITDRHTAQKILIYDARQHALVEPTRPVALLDQRRTPTGDNLLRHTRNGAKFSSRSVDATPEGFSWSWHRRQVGRHVHEKAPSSMRSYRQRSESRAATAQHQRRSGDSAGGRSVSR